MTDNISERISVIETKVDMFIDEMREQNKMRAAEIRAMDEKILKLQESTDAKILKLQESTDAKFDKIDAKFDKIDAKISKLEEKIDGMGKHVRNLAVTAMIGIGAMAAAVIGITYAAVTKM